MSADASVMAASAAGTGVAVAVVAAIALIIVPIIVVAARAERRRFRALLDAAARSGWAPPDRCPPPPGPAHEAFRSRRTKLGLGRRADGLAVWMCWHQWRHTTGNGEDTTIETHNRTWYYLPLPGRYPDVAIVHRTNIGGELMPVRGAGTGDAAFDRAFIVKPPDDPRPTALLSPTLRQAMVHQKLPEWQITAGTLITVYPDRPTLENFAPRATSIVNIARLLITDATPSAPPDGRGSAR